jgi:ferrous iron transport protein A
MIPAAGSGVFTNSTEDVMTLDQLKTGQTAVITAVKGEGALRLRLLDMGLIPRTKVTLQKTAPMGDPLEIRIRGYELTLRIADAKNIEISEPGDQE